MIQLAVIALGVLIYLPFMKLSEKIQSKSAGMDEEDEEEGEVVTAEEA